MKRIRSTFLAVVAATILATPAIAQDKPTVSGLLAQGYQVIHSEISSTFLQFLLKKDNQIVWCTVSVQTGETSSCRNIK